MIMNVLRSWLHLLFMGVTAFIVYNGVNFISSDPCSDQFPTKLSNITRHGPNDTHRINVIIGFDFNPVGGVH